MIRKAFTVLKWLFIAYLVLLAGAYFFQEKLIFHPEKLPENHQFSLAVDFEEVNLRTKDNQVINSLYLKVKNPKGVILYFHGNAGSLERWKEIVTYFTELDYDVFIIDYRGYGKSTGSFNEGHMYADARLAYDFVKERYAQNEIIVYGRSLGTTFATYVASLYHPKLLILEAPFYSLQHVAKSKYPMIPTALLKYNFATNSYLNKVKCPIIIFHGTDDWVVPIEESEKLINEIKLQDKEYISIENGGHNNLIEFDIYKEKVKTLLN